MKFLNLNLLTVLVLALCLSLLFGCTGKDYSEFAKCLSSKNIKMYGAYWCPHCKDQKQQFGDAWKYVNYVECAELDNPNVQTAACVSAGINQYPTWVFGDGTKVTGAVSFEELSAKSGCTLPT